MPLLFVAAPAHAATMTTGTSAVLTTVSGTGTVDVTTARLSGVRNARASVASVCDGYTTGAATFNIDSSKPVVHRVGFSGKSCKIKIDVQKVTGSQQSVSATAGNVRKVSGTSVVVRQPWNTRLVKQSSDFWVVKTPSNSSGLLGLQVTGCTSKVTTKGSGAGDSDSTITDGCYGNMRPGGSSTVTVQVYSGGKLLASTSRYVSYARHHDNIAIHVPKVSGYLQVRVKVSGAPVLVHGPGTTFIGVR